MVVPQWEESVGLLWYWVVLLSVVGVMNSTVAVAVGMPRCDICSRMEGRKEFRWTDKRSRLSLFRRLLLLCLFILLIILVEVPMTTVGAVIAEMGELVSFGLCLARGRLDIVRSNHG